MPYGIDKKYGGDNTANVKWMESCVKAVQGSKGKNGKVIDQGGAIAICKVTMAKRMDKMMTKNGKKTGIMHQ